jgi:hypothetical protein
MSKLLFDSYGHAKERMIDLLPNKWLLHCTPRKLQVSLEGTLCPWIFLLEKEEGSYAAYSLREGAILQVLLLTETNPLFNFGWSDGTNIYSNFWAHFP